MGSVPYWKKQPGRVQQMMRLGVPIDVTTAELTAGQPAEKLRIDHQIGAVETLMFDLDTGGTGYILSLSLTVLRAPFAIEAFTLALPWDQRPVIWLADPAETIGPDSPYRFPGTQSLVIPRDEVINHYADAGRNLRPGKRIEGVLLGYGFDDIRECFVHGSETVGRLGIVDQFGVQHSAEINFWIDRSTKLFPKKRNAPPRKSLFADPDCRGTSYS
jgi:hypothetical protein